MKSLDFLSVRATYKAVRSRLIDFVRDRSGNVAVITALALPALIGATGLSAEVSYWYLTQRSMQNAADSAAIAAATNGTANYAVEAKAAAARYGFVDGLNNITVTASNTATCPSGGANCYSATVTGYVPVFLSQVIGYKGTTALRHAADETQCDCCGASRPDAAGILHSGAWDQRHRFRHERRSEGGIEGLQHHVEAGARCNGNNLGADYGDAAGTNDGCGMVQRSNVPPLADPYAGLRSNIPADPCGRYYPQMEERKLRHEHACRRGLAQQVANWRVALWRP